MQNITPPLQGAAYNLIGALCKGCLENLRFVVDSVKEMFYNEGSESVTVWDFVPHIQPRQPKGFYTCFSFLPFKDIFPYPTSLLSSPQDHGSLLFLPILYVSVPGFVGLKNGGATCYMNAVLQQLYMIPELRAQLLSLPTSSPTSLADTKLHHVGVAQQVGPSSTPLCKGGPHGSVQCLLHP